VDEKLPGPRMGRPAAVPGERRTRDRILDAAINLFARDGFDQTPVRCIAAAVGLTEGAVYRHFPGKEAILGAILAYAEECVYAPLPVETGLGGDGASVFEGLLAPLPAIIEANPVVVKIMRILYIEMFHNEKVRRFFRAEFMERADDHLAGLFGRCIELGTIRDCDPRELASVFNAFRSEWAFKAYILDGEAGVDPEAARDDLRAAIRFFERMLCPKECADDTEIDRRTSP